MKFDSVAGKNSTDRMAVLGKPLNRYEADLKTTGTATYAYEWQDVAPGFAYGYVLGAAIAKGRITSIDTRAAERAPGVVAVVTYLNAGKPGVGKFYFQKMLAAPEVDHYHQPVAVVVAETFEQARAAAALIGIEYQRADGRFDLDRDAAAGVRGPHRNVPGRAARNRTAQPGPADRCRKVLRGG